MQHKFNEDTFNIKEVVNRLENENSYLKRENKKCEELIESNKSLIEEFQRKLVNPNSDNKLQEIEIKLKQLADNENAELKKKVLSKEDMIQKLNAKIKNYEDSMKVYSEELAKLKLKSDEISVDEIRRKDETINYYKNQLEEKEKFFNEEQQLVSSLFHQLALQYNILKAKYNNSEGNLNWTIDKL